MGRQHDVDPGVSPLSHLPAALMYGETVEKNHVPQQPVDDLTLWSSWFTFEGLH